jgi:hypothetical protein
MELAAVRGKAVADLNRVNAQLVQVQCGHLVAVPISRRAQQPGPLAEFLLDIGLDPFGQWNTLHYAANPEGARIMDALPYDPSREGLFEAEFTAVIERARAEWEAFLADPASLDEAKLRGYRAALADALRDLGVAVQDGIYAGRAHRWRHFFGLPPRDPAAPPAPPPAGLPPSPARRAGEAGSVVPPAPAPESLDAARIRHETRLAALRRQAGGDAAAGPVVLALCPGALVPGPTADRLLSFGADPFGEWNIVLAGGDRMAHPPDPEGFADLVSGVIAGLAAAWAAFAEGPEARDPQRAEAMRGYLRRALAEATAPWRAALAGDGSAEGPGM